MRDLDVQDAITLLLAMAVLVLTVALLVVTRQRDEPPPDEVWAAFHATVGRRWRRAIVREARDIVYGFTHPGQAVRDAWPRARRGRRRRPRRVGGAR
ncbi:MULTISPECIES: hypothetical protein [Micromonospora]|uniref:hypothetical protein n=1 Tax=Micromonospora TaxID=1873 RepID=UPI0021A81F0D|nr:hypothetical protein [Micromonospora chalcea]MCT2276346.1 hypothetical protein [Micromonospora chalcea]